MLTHEPLASVAHIRDMEARAIAALGHDAYALMERAGLAAWQHARIHFPASRTWTVCCGTGNNGGDGYLFAAHAARAGRFARVLRTGMPATAEAARAARECLDAGVATELFEDGPLPAADSILDAVLGIGIYAAPRGIAQKLIDAMNASDAPVLALDVPSGLDADRGNALGSCVDATQTLTFLARKPGLYTGVGARFCRVVTLADLGVPFTGESDTPSLTLLASRAAAGLPPRSAADHKGLRGRALLVGGDLGMGGAIALAGEACARVGAGVTAVITRSAHVGAVLARRPELMVQGDDGSVDDSGFSEIALRHVDVIGIGPGLGQQAWGVGWMQRVLASESARVFDADALNYLAANPCRLRASDILTPHPGEAARLLGFSTSDIERDRIGAARILSHRYNAVCVLKGAGTVISDPAGRVAVSPHSVPALATGGSGDVLTGIITGLRAQGLDAWDAACVGVLAHAECGVHASARHGARGVVAGDLAACLPIILNR